MYAFVSTIYPAIYTQKYLRQALVHPVITWCLVLFEWQTYHFYIALFMLRRCDPLVAKDTFWIMVEQNGAKHPLCKTKLSEVFIS